MSLLLEILRRFILPWWFIWSTLPLRIICFWPYILVRRDLLLLIVEFLLIVSISFIRELSVYILHRLFINLICLSD